MNDDEVRQIAVHPAAWEWLSAAIEARGFRLGRMPVDDGVPTYIMSPRDPEPAVLTGPGDEFVDITWSILGTREVPPEVEDYLDTVFDELARVAKPRDVILSAVSSNDTGHTYRSLEAHFLDMHLRIAAAMKLLVESGDATPQGSRIIHQILDQYA